MFFEAFVNVHCGCCSGELGQVGVNLPPAHTETLRELISAYTWMCSDCRAVAPGVTAPALIDEARLLDPKVIEEVREAWESWKSDGMLVSTGKLSPLEASYAKDPGDMFLLPLPGSTRSEKEVYRRKAHRDIHHSNIVITSLPTGCSLAEQEDKFKAALRSLYIATDREIEYLIANIMARGWSFLPQTHRIKLVVLDDYIRLRRSGGEGGEPVNLSLGMYIASSLLTGGVSTAFRINPDIDIHSIRFLAHDPFFYLRPLPHSDSTVWLEKYVPDSKIKEERLAVLGSVMGSPEEPAETFTETLPSKPEVKKATVLEAAEARRKTNSDWSMS